MPLCRELKLNLFFILDYGTGAAGTGVGPGSYGAGLGGVGSGPGSFGPGGYGPGGPGAGSYGPGGTGPGGYGHSNAGTGLGGVGTGPGGYGAGGAGALPVVYPAGGQGLGKRKPMKSGMISCILRISHYVFRICKNVSGMNRRCYGLMGCFYQYSIIVTPYTHFVLHCWKNASK